MDIVNEKFLSDPTPLLEKAFALLSEVLFHPNTKGDTFDSATVDNEKRSLKQRIQSIFDDKMRYASTRLVEEMCATEPYALEASGNLEDLEKVTAASLYEYYQKALNEDEIDLYVIGDVSEEEVDRLENQYISLSDREPIVLPRQVERKISEEKEVIEKLDVKQGKLNIGFRSNISYGDPEYFALQVYNGLFGGFSHSKLFLNVREKASLAYYASSRLESHKGLLIVMSGIENANYKQALDIIKEQFSLMQQGDFTEDEIQQTKAVVKNQLLETIDVPRGLIEILYHNVIAKTTITLDEWLEKTETITKEEIVDVAKQIQLDTIYFLTGTEVQK